MALQDVLASIPGRGAYLAQQQFDQQQTSAGLGQLIGLMNARRQQEQLAQEQQLQPLRMEMLRAHIARQQQETNLRGQADERTQTALTGLEAALGQMLPGSPAQMDAADNVMTPGRPDPRVALFRNAAQVSPRDALDMALQVAGMGKVGGKGVDPMIQRNISVRDQLRARADQAEAQGDTGLAAKLRADADSVQRVIDFESSKAERAVRDLDRKELETYDRTGTRPQQASRPGQQQPQPSGQQQLAFPSSGYNPNPTPTTRALMAEAGTDRDMSSEAALRGAVVGAASADSPPTSPKTEREVDASRRKELVQLNTKTYGELRAKLPELNATVRSLDKLQQLADSGQTFSNAGAEFKMQLSNIAQAVGIKINFEELSSSELARQQLAELLKARLGSKDYGSGNAVSNLDLIAAREPLPDLVRSPEGQRKIIRALAQDARERREDINAFRDSFERTRGDMTGFRYPSELKTEERLKVIESSRDPRSSSGQIRQGGQIRFLGFE